MVEMQVTEVEVHLEIEVAVEAGGAGAGIGGNGGNGGQAGTTFGDRLDTNSGSDGEGGENGGTLCIYGELEVYAYGGSGGAGGYDSHSLPAYRYTDFRTGFAVRMLRGSGIWRRSCIPHLPQRE